MLHKTEEIDQFSAIKIQGCWRLIQHPSYLRVFSCFEFTTNGERHANRCLDIGVSSLWESIYRFLLESLRRTLWLSWPCPSSFRSVLFRIWWWISFSNTSKTKLMRFRHQVLLRIFQWCPNRSIPWKSDLWALEQTVTNTVWLIRTQFIEISAAG